MKHSLDARPGTEPPSDAKIAFLRVHGMDGQSHSSETLLDHRIKHRQTGEWVAISQEDQRRLVEMVAANNLEQLPRMEPDIQVRSLGFFAMLRDHVSDTATTSIDAMVENVRSAAEK